MNNKSIACIWYNWNLARTAVELQIRNDLTEWPLPFFCIVNNHTFLGKYHTSHLESWAVMDIVRDFLSFNKESVLVILHYKIIDANMPFAYIAT